LFGGAGVTENEVTVAGKCAVGWVFGKCVNGTGGGGAAVTGKGIFSVYLFDEFDTVFVVGQLNQRKYLYYIHLKYRFTLLWKVTKLVDVKYLLEFLSFYDVNHLKLLTTPCSLM